MEVHPQIDRTIAARHRLTSHRRHPLGKRIRARVFTSALDHRLADGADPRTDASLTLRAEHLGSAHVRHSLAAGLRDSVARAHRPVRLSSAAPISRTAVLDNEAQLLELAERLEHEPAGEVAGIATANLLLTEGASPLWVNGSPLELREQLALANFRLGFHPEATR